MLLNIFTRKIVVVVCLTLVVLNSSNGAEQGEGNVDFHGLKLRHFSRSLEKIYKEVDANNWPKTSILRKGLMVDKTMLTNENLVTRGRVSCSDESFGGKEWFGGVCRFNWDRFVKNTEPLPTDLPPERKQRWLERMKPEKRNDPNFVEEYLARKLKAHRKSKMYKGTGFIRGRIYVAPDSEAANASLMRDWGSCTLPIQGIVSQFAESNKNASLGTVSFVVNGRIAFVRDNIAVTIDARGEFADEGLELAKKIDDLIKQQPALTYEQLMARRPVITIENKAKKANYGFKSVGFEVQTPAGVEVVKVRAYDEGNKSRTLSVNNGRVELGSRDKNTRRNIKITAITDELLCGTVEKEVVIEEQQNPGGN
jgi:hypothetical protein